MVYKLMVEIGRIVFIGKGKDEGKLAAIVDVIDGNRVSFWSLYCLSKFSYQVIRCELFVLLETK